MMDQSSKVSVLVPSYNHGRYIRERIESIINQTYVNIELIVIDDGSEDNSDDVIRGLQAQHGFAYLRNKQNSGTPFSAWERVSSLATGEYIWVCESDDIAESSFVEMAVASLAAEPDAVMFYSSSHVINEAGEIIGHTDSYFHDIWKETRWDGDFIADGRAELIQFQLRGQTLPNMSSALFTANAFSTAYTPFLKRLRLTGDWLFVGEVLKQGKVVFNHTALNRFRKHEVTSRVRVKSARSQAEFILTKYRLFCGSGQPISRFAPLMGSDVIRFLYEPASWLDVSKELLKVSWPDTIRFVSLLLISTSKNTAYIRKFKERFNHAKK
ncbi:glycosyltransferase [Polynucleobacter sp. AP-Sanab-80-C2]|uniref:glycosyltransferase family 2 protein n=1 Tax=Polynucleobacter sp. AP-Sanab-80-C2 TaxID=3108274 RepID=UPI002B22CAED|nr:glycosyltransferase [Polynucleobacter sp. AP-Sanab-80-C2]MEA9598532.1 glycosyltransferase [Polynucleobacter sp. AP-Sanab-80-C2]